MSGGITYGGIEFLEIHLGGGADTFTISGTHAGQTDLSTGGGSDTIHVRSISGPTSIAAGFGSDTVNVRNTSGRLEDIDALLSIHGGGNPGDVLNVDDSGDSANSTGTLTSSRITGLGLSDDGIAYAGFAKINLDLGSGHDTFTVESTAATTVTTVRANLGDDTIRVGSPSATLDDIDGIELVVQGGGGNDRLEVDDSGDTAVNAGLLESSRLAGLGMSGLGIGYAGFETLTIALGSGGDTFRIDATHAGQTSLAAGGGNDAVTIRTISGPTDVQGGGDDDTVTVNPDKATVNGLAAALDLDGQAGSDHVIVNAFGSGSSVINVRDTGASGTDLLTVNGTAVGDQFLLRANFAGVLDDADGDGAFDTVERINYDANVEGFVINGLDGDDRFASDDNATATTLNGGEGADRFQIGQLFGADRLPPHVAAGDEIGTVAVDLSNPELAQTVVGYLSNGASHPLTANGGGGEDVFVLFRNQAEVDLNGDAGNDVFTVRAFALASTGQVDQDTTNVSGGDGDDAIEYAANAPTNIDGGDGGDTVQVLGTQFGDRFVITDQGVFGAGLFISYTGIEALDVHTGDGDDEVYVLSTHAAVATAVYGGAGSDHVFVGEDPPADPNLPAFPPQPHTLAGIGGPVLVHGAPGDPAVFAIGLPILLPTETDLPLPEGAGQHSATEQEGDVDVLDVVDTGATSDDTGRHAADAWPTNAGELPVHTLSGLGMGGGLVLQDSPTQSRVFPGGISYAGLEIMEAQLGSGHETLDIEDVAAGVTTIFRGHAGDDTFHVTAPAVVGAMLVIYGDTSASGTQQGGPGDDMIDASGSSMGATYYGGAGSDTIHGGSGADRIAGGRGDDLLNAEDNLETNGGLNDQPDAAPFADADRAYGGAGRDVLLANTGADRLIDWVGEFNSYLVPFAPYGNPTISRTVQPQLPEFLLALSRSDGADSTLGFDPSRNGEPYAELGMVLQQDPDWQVQTGAPADLQAGNIPGGSRDVLRASDFNDGTMAGFAPDSDVWKVASGSLQVAAESLGKDAVSVYYVDQQLPPYFEVTAAVKAVKPGGGWKSNAYIIFDYQNPNDFKFAGIYPALNKMEMGHRTPGSWVVDVQSNVQAKPDLFYNLKLAVNGLTVTLVVNGTDVFTHAFAPRVVDGLAYGLNWGLVGMGSDNSRGVFDNVTVQRLPPQITFDILEDYSDGQADLFTPQEGSWGVSAGRYAGTPAPGGAAVTTLALDVAPLSYLELQAKVNAGAGGVAGLVFDLYGPTDLKFAGVRASTGEVVVGHRTKKGWVIDKAVARSIQAGVDYTLGIALKGTMVNVTLNGQPVLGYAFNALVVDGDVGLLARDAAASFDDVVVKGDDPNFHPEKAAGGASGAGVMSLRYTELTPVVAEAVRRWSGTALAQSSGVSLGDVPFYLVDLGGSMLGLAHGLTVLLDATAAGHGWFVDPTPADDAEFIRPGDQGEAGRVDLLTVVLHELGHVLGLEDLDPAEHAGELMAGTLTAGTRRDPEGEELSAATATVLTPAAALVPGVTVLTLAAAHRQETGLPLPPADAVLLAAFPGGRAELASDREPEWRRYDLARLGFAREQVVDAAFTSWPEEGLSALYGATAPGETSDDLASLLLALDEEVAAELAGRAQPDLGDGFTSVGV